VRHTQALIVATALICAATLAGALDPQLNVVYRPPALHVAIETAVLLVALLVAVLVFGRFLRLAQLTDLMLASALGCLAGSELIFVALPVLAGRIPQDFSVWAALAGGAFGAMLFALAAFVPHRRLRRPGFALVASATVVATALLLIAVLAVLFADRLPKVPVPVTARGPPVRAQPAVSVALLAPEAGMAAIYGLAAAGFLRRARQDGDGFFGWLALAAVLAAASHVNYLMYPSASLRFLTVGDVFRLFFYVAVLMGSGRYIRSCERSLSDAAVMEERRRIARELHDGVAQELAYLRRNLESLDSAAGSETAARLRQAAERAHLEVRLAVSTLSDLGGQSVDRAIARAAAEVAARDHIRLELDVAHGVWLSAAQAEALVRIACEAVGNAAHHSGAGRVSLSLRRDGSHVRLRVSDSGSGFDPAVPAMGFGLISMRERASSVGGDLRISAVLGHGTEVEATL
jgi:signal transduction histidine kinase